MWHGQEGSHRLPGRGRLGTHGLHKQEKVGERVCMEYICICAYVQAVYVSVCMKVCACMRIEKYSADTKWT